MVKLPVWFFGERKSDQAPFKRLNRFLKPDFKSMPNGTKNLSLVLENHVGQRDTKEENCHDNSGLEKSFFNAAFGTINIAVATKGCAQTSAAGLQKNTNNKNYG